MAIPITAPKQKGLISDGVNDYILGGNVPFTTQTTSINFTFSLNGLGDQVWFINNPSAITTGIFIYYVAGSLYVQRGRGGGSGRADYINLGLIANTIYTFCIIYNNNLTQDLYVNGVLITKSASTTGGSLIRTAPFNIGLTELGIPSFNGILYDLKIFNKALNATEVLALYNGTSIPSGLVIDYRFDNQNGFTLTDYQSGLNGTLTNYTAGDVTVGSGNKWLYQDNQSPYTGTRENKILLLNSN